MCGENDSLDKEQGGYLAGSHPFLDPDDVMPLQGEDMTARRIRTPVASLKQHYLSHVLWDLAAFHLTAFAQKPSQISAKKQFTKLSWVF